MQAISMHHSEIKSKEAERKEIEKQLEAFGVQRIKKIPQHVSALHAKEKPKGALTPKQAQQKINSSLYSAMDKARRQEKRRV